MKKRKNSFLKSGFTLIELMLSMSLCGVVLAATLGTFIWCGKESILCTKIAWSQREAMNSSTSLLAYIRNASKIIAIDSDGMWVELEFPDGTVRKLMYLNPTTRQRDGNLHLVEENAVTGEAINSKIVTSGMTAPQSVDGKAGQQIFISELDGRVLRIAYQVSKPGPSGERAQADKSYNVDVYVSAYLRNAG